MDYRPIKDLDFGFADARNYQSPSELERFKRIYFPDLEKIEKLKNEPIYFVVGDKGTGKTALATYFVNGLDDAVDGISIYLQKDDFTRIYSFVSQDEDFDNADYVEIWKSIFSLVICFRAVQSALTASATVPDNCLKFYERLQKLSFNSFDASIQGSFKVLMSQAKSAAHAFLGSEYSGRTQLSFYLRAMQSYLDAIYSSMTIVKGRHFLFVDGLDVRPSEGSGTQVAHLANVTGLISAMFQLNNEGMASRHNGLYRVVVLVRPDIFEKLELQNANNIWRTNTIQIQYAVKFKLYKPSSLFKMADSILYTQQAFFPQNGYEVGSTWTKYLPDSFERKRTKHVIPDSREDSFIAILRSTFNRPRDIFYFLNYWKITAVANGDGLAPYFDPKYTFGYQFRNLFNEYLLGEIRDSLAFYTDVSNYIIFIQFFRHLEPRLPLITLDSKRNPGARFRVRRQEFTSDDFYVSHKEFIGFIEKRVEAHVPDSFRKPELFIQLLYELGLVFYKSEGSDIRPDGSSPLIWKTYSDAKAAGDFRPQVRLDGDYRLHRGLSRAIYKDVM